MLIDAHAHLDRYDEDRLRSALEEITRHRIFTISNSVDLPSYRRNLEISETHELVLPTFGVHPWNAPEYGQRLEGLREPAERSPMLGEIGLDFHFVRDTSQYPDQRKVFEFFLATAKEQGKIINLHAKGAEAEVLDLLLRYDIRRAIVHWYSGSLDVLEELIARRVYFTVGVEVLYSEHIQAIARKLPTELLLTETDNPGGPRSLTGTPGMSSLVRDVVQVLADARQTTVEAITQTVQGNLLQLVRDDPWLADTCETLSVF